MAQVTKLTRFQQDITNNAVQALHRQLASEVVAAVYKKQLAEMFQACPWLCRDEVQRRAEKRVLEDASAVGEDSGRILV